MSFRNCVIHGNILDTYAHIFDYSRFQNGWSSESIDKNTREFPLTILIFLGLSSCLSRFQWLFLACNCKPDPLLRDLLRNLEIALLPNSLFAIDGRLAVRFGTDILPAPGLKPSMLALGVIRPKNLFSVALSAIFV